MSPQPPPMGGRLTPLPAKGGVSWILHLNLGVSVAGAFWAHSLTVFPSADIWVALFLFGHFLFFFFLYL